MLKLKDEKRMNIFLPVLFISLMNNSLRWKSVRGHIYKVIIEIIFTILLIIYSIVNDAYIINLIFIIIFCLLDFLIIPKIFQKFILDIIESEEYKIIKFSSNGWVIRISGVISLFIFL
jgi:hypothetical protein